jgi:hypothetical protein
MSLWLNESFREEQFAIWAKNLVDNLGYEPNLKTPREYWNEGEKDGQAFMPPRVDDIIKLERQSPKDFDSELAQFTACLKKSLPNGDDPEAKTAKEYFVEGYSKNWALYCEHSYRSARVHDGSTPDEMRHYWNSVR